MHKCKWRHCFLSCDFPPFILNYPPPNPPHALGGLLKLNGLRGGKRDADPRCNFICWCRCWTVSLQKQVIYTPFNVIFHNICMVLFLYYKFFSSNILRRHRLPCLLRGNAPDIYIYIYIYTHIHTCICIYTCIHSTHTHTYIYIYSLLIKFKY